MWLVKLWKWMDPLQVQRFEQVLVAGWEDRRFEEVAAVRSRASFYFFLFLFLFQIFLFLRGSDFDPPLGQISTHPGLNFDPPRQDSGGSRSRAEPLL